MLTHEVPLIDLAIYWWTDGAWWSTTDYWVPMQQRMVYCHDTSC